VPENSDDRVQSAAYVYNTHFLPTFQDVFSFRGSGLWPTTRDFLLGPAWGFAADLLLNADLPQVDKSRKFEAVSGPTWHYTCCVISGSQKNFVRCVENNRIMERPAKRFVS